MVGRIYYWRCSKVIIDEFKLLDELTVLLEDALTTEDINRINKIIHETLKEAEMDKTE